MPTSPTTSRLAAVTYTFPGPTILSTGGTVSVPYAMAATACAPPALTTRSAPARCAANSTAGRTEPSGPGGVHSTTRSTPATRAGTTVMHTVEGYAARPPGA